MLALLPSLHGTMPFVFLLKLTQSNGPIFASQWCNTHTSSQNKWENSHSLRSMDMTSISTANWPMMHLSHGTWLTINFGLRSSMVTMPVPGTSQHKTTIFVPALTSTIPSALGCIVNMHTDATSVEEWDTPPSHADSIHQPQLLQLQHKIVTPVNTDQLEHNLQDYLDRQLVQQVIQGFREGFLLKYYGPRTGRTHPNLASAKQFPK